MITERTLRNWRKEALVLQEALEPLEDDLTAMVRFQARDYVNKVIRMTQELLDQHLLRGRR